MSKVDKISAKPETSFKRDTERMVRDIDELVSGDWAFSVTDDMVELPGGGYKKFSQEQAEEMSKAIGSVYMIAHGIDCSTCGRKYATGVSNITDSQTNTELNRELVHPDLLTREGDTNG